MRTALMSRRKTSLTLLLLLLPVGFHLLFRLGTTDADPDLWHNLFFGRHVVTGGAFPWVDSFIYVPARASWLVQNWLAALFYYALHEFWGPGGIQAFKYLAGCGTGALLYVAARRRGASAPASAGVLLLVSCAFATAFSPIRPQVFSYLFYVLTFLFLDTTRQRKRPSRAVWLLPLGFALWANLHAGVFAGLWLVGCYALVDCVRSRRVTPTGLLFVLCCLGTLLTPYGVEYWTYVIDETLHPAGQDVTEWLSLAQALNGDLLENSLLFVFSLALVILLHATARKRDPVAMLVLALTAFLGCTSIRHQIFFMLTCGVCLPELLDQFAARLPAHSALVRLPRRIGLPGLAVVSLATSLWWGSAFLAKTPLSITLPDTPGVSSSKMYYPLGAMEHLERNHASGNLLPTLQWGSYALWRLSPDFKLGMDGRFKNIYPNEVIRDYFAFLNAKQNWHRFLEKYETDYILIRPTDGAAFLLRSDPEWRVDYEDAGAVLFVRAK